MSQLYGTLLGSFHEAPVSCPSLPFSPPFTYLVSIPRSSWDSGFKALVKGWSRICS